MNAALRRWLVDVANARQHGTTRKRPDDLLVHERAAMRPLPSTTYELVTWHHALVHRDSHVEFDRRLYSIPWRYLGQRVWLRATPTTVTAYVDETRVATHQRRGSTTRSTNGAHLPEEREPWRHRSREFWQQRADRMSPEVGAYVRDLFDSDDVLSMLRTVQAVVTHLEGYPVERATKACARATHYGSRSYAAIKNILRQGLDLAPLPATTPTAPSLPCPRFARPIGELWHAKEASDELH